jgi:hypothetical protein
MDSKQLAELLSEPFAVLSSDINKLQRLVSFYAFIYGSANCMTCGGESKYETYYQQLKNEGLTMLENKELANFEFRPGINGVPVEFGSATFVTVGNMTDELAIQLLSNNENGIALFSKYPADWKDMVAQYKSNKTKKAAPVEVTVQKTEDSTTATTAQSVPVTAKSTAIKQKSVIATKK